jgi:nitroreductase
MKYDGFLELVKSRRSIRKFKSDPISDEEIDKIIEAARFAPSGANTQPWEFLVIKNQELKDGILQIINEMRNRDGVDKQPLQNASETRHSHSSNDTGEAPVFIMLLGDERARIGLPGKAGQDDRKWQSVLTSSLASAFLYMHLAATALGLASQWQSGVERPDARQKLGKLLGLPDELHIYDMMVVGYPDAPPAPKELRKRSEMVHFNSCHKEDIRTDEEIREFFARSRNH